MSARTLLLAAAARVVSPGATLDLSFMAPGSLPSGVTFARASTGTYFDATGTMQTAATNTPRWDCDPATGALKGLLIEDARTNLLLNSATLVTQSVTVTAVATTLSFYGTGTVTLSGVSTAGPLTGTGVNNRVSLTFTPTAGTLTCTVTGSVLNAQLESAPMASSYILTAGATATRAVELATMSTTGWINQLASSLQAEFMIPYSPVPAALGFVAAELDDGTTSTLLGIRLQSALQMNAFAFKANAVQGALSGPLPTAANAVLKAAAALDNQTFICAVATNGAIPGTTFTLSGGALPTLTRLNIGSGRTNAVNGWVRRVRYWPRALSGAELQAITR
jgi:hypothetical protein